MGHWAAWVPGKARAAKRALLFFSFFLLCASVHGAATYKLKRLPLPRGTAATRADSINERGDVLIDAVTRGGAAQAHVLHSKKFIALGFVSGLSNTWGQCIGDSGVVIGSAANADSDEAAVFYHDGVLHPITSADGGVQLVGVTSNGVVLGTIDSSQPFLATNGVMTFLDLPNAFPLAINNAGVLAGTVYVDGDAGAQLRAALFTGTNVTFIPTDEIGSGNSIATALNDAGHAAGVVSSNGVNRGFLFRDGGTIDLGLVEGWNGLSPSAINERDQIVGFAVDGADELVDPPFVWEAGVLTNLSQFVKKRHGAIAPGQTIDINDAGLIVTTVTKKGRTRAVIFTPKAQAR